MKRPLRNMRVFGPVFRYNQSENENTIVRILSRWGAKDIDTNTINDRTLVEFHTPMPGDQPIKSSITLEDGVVIGGIVRYGVLDIDEYINSYPLANIQEWHPSFSRSQINRLKKAVKSSDNDISLAYEVDYGDNKVVRPHIRFGNAFEDLRESTPEYWIVKEQGQSSIPIKNMMDFLIDIEDSIFDEFIGEWQY